MLVVTWPDILDDTRHSVARLAGPHRFVPGPVVAGPGAFVIRVFDNHNLLWDL